MAAQIDLKVVLLGHTNVGKTSVFNRFVYDDFGKTDMTIGAYFAMKQLPIGDRSYNLAVWDTAGEEKFDSLTNFYCRGARAAIICYDITSGNTFNEIQRWVEKIKHEADDGCSIILVGNKYDLVEESPSKRQVSYHEAQKFSKSIGADCIEASAASGYNVSEAFTKVVSKCISNGGASARRADSLRAKEDDKPCCS